jgi:tetratricopeptide (TPR) repeat protein
MDQALSIDRNDLRILYARARLLCECSPKEISGHFMHQAEMRFSKESAIMKMQNSEVYRQVLFNRVLANYAFRSFDRALDACEEYLSIPGAHNMFRFECLFKRASCHFELGNISHALSNLDSLLELPYVSSSQKVIVLWQRGRVLHLQGDFNAAIRDLLQALQYSMLDDHVISSYAAIISAYKESGFNAEAMQRVEEALLIFPKSAKLWEIKARLLQWQPSNNYELVVECLECGLMSLDSIIQPHSSSKRLQIVKNLLQIYLSLPDIDKSHKCDLTFDLASCMLDTELSILEVFSALDILSSASLTCGMVDAISEYIQKTLKLKHEIYENLETFYFGMETNFYRNHLEQLYHLLGHFYLRCGRIERSTLSFQLASVISFRGHNSFYYLKHYLAALIQGNMHAEAWNLLESKCSHELNCDRSLLLLKSISAVHLSKYSEALELLNQAKYICSVQDNSLDAEIEHYLSVVYRKLCLPAKIVEKLLRILQNPSEDLVQFRSRFSTIGFNCILSNQGSTPLSEISKFGYFEKTQFLLDHKANLSCIDLVSLLLNLDFFF